MKIGMLLILAVLAVIGARAFHYAQDPDEKAHQQWLEARYQEATSIQPGMTRSDLLKLFTEDGGFRGGSRDSGGGYVLKSCDLIKIEVKFEKSAGDSPAPKDELKIAEVSKPYLEHMHLD